jgi:hypothetical protein
MISSPGTRLLKAGNLSSMQIRPMKMATAQIENPGVATGVSFNQSGLAD